MPRASHRRRPGYNLEARQQAVAIGRMVEARLGERHGTRLASVEPRGIHFYLLQFGFERVRINRLSQNAARCDAIALPFDERTRIEFERLGYAVRAPE